MKATLFIFLFAVSLSGITQTGLFTDPRDGQLYKTIVIDSKTWFRENLRFQTAHSFCPNYNKTAPIVKTGTIIPTVN